MRKHRWPHWWQDWNVCKEDLQTSTRKRSYMSPQEAYKISHCVITVTGMKTINGLCIYCPNETVKSKLPEAQIQSVPPISNFIPEKIYKEPATTAWCQRNDHGQCEQYYDGGVSGHTKYLLTHVCRHWQIKTNNKTLSQMIRLIFKQVTFIFWTDYIRPKEWQHKSGFKC